MVIDAEFRVKYRSVVPFFFSPPVRFFIFTLRPDAGGLVSSAIPDNAPRHADATDRARPPRSACFFFLSKANNVHRTRGNERKTIYPHVVLLLRVDVRTRKFHARTVSVALQTRRHSLRTIIDAMMSMMMKQMIVGNDTRASARCEFRPHTHIIIVTTATAITIRAIHHVCKNIETDARNGRVESLAHA